MHIKSILKSLGATALLLTATASYGQTTFVKANNALPLNDPATWTNNFSLPSTFDTNVWDSTVTGPNTVALGDSFQLWGLLKILNPGGLVTINDPANYVSIYAIGGQGIDMTAATQNLLMNCGVSVAAAQTWNVASGRTLTLASTNNFQAFETKKDGTGRLVFSGVSPYTGNNTLTLLGGLTQLTGGNDRLPTATHLQVGTATFDVGGNSQTLGRLRFAYSSSNTNSQAVVTNGSVIVNDAILATGNDNDFATGPGSLFDMSGLTSFTFDCTNRQMRVLPYGQLSNNSTNTVLLAKTGPLGGTNFIKASTLQVGGASGSSANNNHMGILRMGTANKFQVNLFQIGGFNARGTVNFQPGLSSPSLVVRDRAGTGRAATLKVGETSSGSRSGEGLLDLTSGSIDAWVTDLQLGRMIAGASVADASTLIMPNGTIDAVNMTLAFKSGNTTVDSPTITSTLFQLGGTVLVQNLIMGTNANSTYSTPVLKPTYNLYGGTLRAANIVAGEGKNSGASTVRSLNWTNGTIRNYDAATDLSINNSTATNGITINAPGAGSRAFNADASHAITVAVSVNQSSATAMPIAKDGAGTLDLQGTTDNPFHGLTINSGTVLLNKTSSGSVHALGNDSTVAGGTLRLTGTGGDQIADVRSVALTSGSFELNGLSETIAGLGGTAGTVSDALGGSTLTLNAPVGSNYSAGATLTGSFSLTKSGLGKQTLYGTDSRSAGSNSVNAGTFEIGNGSATGSLTGDTAVNAGGTLAFNRSGTLTFSGKINGAGNVAQNGSGTLVLAGVDTHTGATLVNAGTLSVPTAASALGGTAITVQTGATLDLTPSSGFALVGQTLNGGGTVVGGVFVGTSSTLGGTLTMRGSVVSGDGSLLLPGGNLTAGTLTITNGLSVGSGTVLRFDLANVTTVGGGVNDLIAVGGLLDVSQPCTLEIRQLGGALAAGTYVLATYGSFSGSTANITLVGSPRFGYALTTVAGQLRLTVSGSPASLTFRGDNTSNPWDDGVTADWFNIGTASLDKFFNGDSVLFNDAGSNSLPVAVTGTVYPSSLSVIASKDYVLAGSGSIAGNAALVKTNAGTLTIQNTNSFTGAVQLNGGAVSVGSVALNGVPSPLGAGSSLDFNGGALRYTGASVPADVFNRQLNLGAGGGVVDISGAAGSFFFVTNLIAGNGSLTKAGTNQLILGSVLAGSPVSGNNTYSGVTYVANGQLQIRSPNALGTTTGKTVVTAPGNLAVGGGWQGVVAEPLDLSGDGGGAGALQVNDGGTAATFSGVLNLVANAAIGGASPAYLAGNITGAGSLTKVGGNTVALLSSANSYAGGTVINAGTLMLGTNSTTGWLPGQPAGVSLTNSAALSFNRSDTATLGVSITGPGTLFQVGDGVTILTGVSDFTGPVAVNNGALRVANTQSLGAATNGTTVAGGANLTARVEFSNGVTVPEAFTLGQKAGTNNLNGAQPPHLVNLTDNNNVTGNVQLTAGGNYWGISSTSAKLTLTTLTNDAGGFVRPIYLEGAGDGLISTRLEDITDLWLQIRKHGTGTWTLDGDIKLPQGFGAFEGKLVIAPTCNYQMGSATQQGFFSVREAGTLAINSVNFPAAGEVDGQGTLIGTGTLNGPVTAKNGTVSPGDPIGTLTFNGGLTMQPGGTLLMELNRSNPLTNDVVGGVITPGGRLTVVNTGPTLKVGDKFQLFQYPIFSEFAATNLPAGYVWKDNLGTDGSIEVLSVTAPTTPTNLTYSVNAGQLTLSWPANYTGWRLLAQTNSLSVGISTNWYLWPGAALTNSVTIPIVPGNPAVFFRMLAP